MKSSLILVLGLLLFSTIAFSWPGDEWPEQRQEQLIASFAIDGPVNATPPRASKLWHATSNDLGVGNVDSEYVVSRAFTMTRVTLVSGDIVMETTEACDVEVVIESPQGGAPAVPSGFTAFEWGGSTVGRTAGSSDSQVVRIAVAAGDQLQIQHSAPSTDYCVDGAACACASATGNYRAEIFGVWR